MRSLKTKAILLLLVAFAYGLRAQAPPKLSIDSVVIPDPDTLNYVAGTNDKIEYNFRLTNVGGLAATGQVDIMFEYNGNSAVSVLSLVVDLESGEFVDTTVTDSLLHPNNDARYEGGGNIIVIWPRAEPDIMAADPDTSISMPYIDSYVGRKPPIAITSRIDIYPNPVHDKLMFNYKKSGSTLEFVRILDPYGRQVYYGQQAISEISMLPYPPGLYYLEFRYRDGVKGIFKVLVQH